MPLHVAHRSGVTTGDWKVRRMREDASPGPRPERDVTEPSHSFHKWVLEERTDEPDPLVTKSDGSHARSHCEQQGHDCKHHSTTEVVSCVGGATS